LRHGHGVHDLKWHHFTVTKIYCLLLNFQTEQLSLPRSVFKCSMASDQAVSICCHDRADMHDICYMYSIYQNTIIDFTALTDCATLLRQFRVMSAVPTFDLPTYRNRFVLYDGTAHPSVFNLSILHGPNYFASRRQLRLDLGFHRSF